MQSEPVSLGTALGAGTGAFKSFRGGQAVVSVDGTFGGSTVTLVTKGPAGGSCTVAGLSLTALGAVALILAAGDYALVVTGGAGQSVNGQIQGVPGF